MDILHKTHYAVRFYIVVAARIVGEIIWLNDGHWPESFSEWQRVSEAIEYELLIIRNAPRLPSCCLLDEKVILIQPERCPYTFHRAVAHEVAHAILDRGSPDGELLDWPRDPEDCHKVARIVEQYVMGDHITRLVGYSFPGECERIDVF